MEAADGVELNSGLTCTYQLTFLAVRRLSDMLSVASRDYRHRSCTGVRCLRNCRYFGWI
jgi:hypothetical protein